MGGAKTYKVDLWKTHHLTKQEGSKKETESQLWKWQTEYKVYHAGMTIKVTYSLLFILVQLLIKFQKFPRRTTFRSPSIESYLPGWKLPSAIGSQDTHLPFAWDQKHIPGISYLSHTCKHIFPEGIHPQLPNTDALEFFLNKKKLGYIAAFISNLLTQILQEKISISSSQYEFLRIN